MRTKIASESKPVENSHFRWHSNGFPPWNFNALKHIHTRIQNVTHYFKEICIVNLLQMRWFLYSLSLHCFSHCDCKTLLSYWAVKAERRKMVIRRKASFLKGRIKSIMFIYFRKITALLVRKKKVIYFSSYTMIIELNVCCGANFSKWDDFCENYLKSHSFIVLYVCF